MAKAGISAPEVLSALDLKPYDYIASTYYLLLEQQHVSLGLFCACVYAMRTDLDKQTYQRLQGSPLLSASLDGHWPTESGMFSPNGYLMEFFHVCICSPPSNKKPQK
jgi:hypothetical protein